MFDGYLIIIYSSFKKINLIFTTYNIGSYLISFVSLKMRKKMIIVIIEYCEVFMNYTHKLLRRYLARDSYSAGVSYCN